MGSSVKSTKKLVKILLLVLSCPQSTLYPNEKNFTHIIHSAKFIHLQSAAAT
jgi:hypothetical protein